MKNETDNLKNFLSELTTEERQQLRALTTNDWAEAITETVNAPGFWQHIGEAFLQGVERGLNERTNRH
jgi:hypothetical protein